MGEHIIFGLWMREVSIGDYNNIVVMQDTGLTDVNGLPIYENDIVQSDIHNPSVFKVEFIEGGFCCTYKDCYPIDINHFHTLEIIGNIFDTPDIAGSNNL